MSELSPYYEKLYVQVAALPAMTAVQDKIVQAFKDAKVIKYTFEKSSWGYRIICNCQVVLGNETLLTDFTLRGDEDPGMHLQYDHLLSEEDLLEVYFDNVGREGKPIKPHGLIKEETVRFGAEPRQKNAFLPWMRRRLINSQPVMQAQQEASKRLARKVIGELKDDPGFVKFAENLTFEHIVAQIGEFTYLPPEVLHRAVDTMYVKSAMEE